MARPSRARSLGRIAGHALLLFLAFSAISVAPAHGAEETGEDLTTAASGPRDSDAQRDVVARAHFHLGELAERAREYPDALAHYRAVLAIDPGNWFASTARARIDALKEYDADFASLARLDAVRKDPTRASEPGAVEALEREAEAFPAGPARIEAFLFVAEAWAGRLNRPERAISPALRVAHDATADDVARATGFELAYSAMRSLGELDRAAREIATDRAAPVAIVRRSQRDVRRRTLHRLAGASLAFGAALLVGSLVETARRRRFAIALETLRNPYALAFLTAAGLGAFALAEAWERAAGAPFLALAGVLLGVHLLVAGLRSGFGDRGASLRLICALGAASCVLAAAYLVLERGEELGRPMLEGFGL